jgi:hypothetical protein
MENLLMSYFDKTSRKKTPAFFARIKETTAMIFLFSIIGAGAAGITFLNEAISFYQSSEGKMIRLIPKDQNTPSKKLEKKEKHHEFKVRGNKANALEHIIILWSNNANHPPTTTL